MPHDLPVRALERLPIDATGPGGVDVPPGSAASTAFDKPSSYNPDV